jgi:hypothetical protein
MLSRCCVARRVLLFAAAFLWPACAADDDGPAEGPGAVDGGGDAADVASDGAFDLAFDGALDGADVIPLDQGEDTAPDAERCESGQTRWCVLDCVNAELQAAECLDGEWVCPLGTVFLDECPANVCSGLPPLCCDPLTGSSREPICDDGAWVCRGALLERPCAHHYVESLDGRWEEQAWLTCDGVVDEVAPEEPRIARLSLQQGAFELRWAAPSSAWYSGTYAYTWETGEVAFAIADGEQIPGDVDLAGRVMTRDAAARGTELAFFGIWFGSAAGGGPPTDTCGHSFRPAAE